ncbi:MAG: hypothetical protein KME08_08620 [Aphanothece sp. CMT-3BRIN-NPC111]|jgi:hypothetical protein|nr:hypothetical protein [Aphanothece sp. CMT-3BRIN-NPC111]
MLTNQKPESKLIHPLARFVTVEAIAFVLKLNPQDIYRIDCWRYVIHVVGKGISTFVSYADIPPIVGVEPPTAADINCWRKRWKKNKFKAPDFWVGFYAQKFKQASYLKNLYAWGELVGIIKFGLSPAAVEWLRSVYIKEKAYSLQSF